VSLAEAVRSYLFNAQLVTLPGGAGMALIVPLEAWESAAVRGWLEGMLAGNGPIRRVIRVDVRQSMANGGGPACLRLRVAADPATVDPRFLLDEVKAEVIAQVVGGQWPEQVDPGDLGTKALAASVRTARLALLESLDLVELA
jgi:succinylarginine dihydrolase